MCSLCNTNHELISNLSYTGAHHHIAWEILYCICMGKHIINTELGYNSQPAWQPAEGLGAALREGSSCLWGSPLLWGAVVGAGERLLMALPILVQCGTDRFLPKPVLVQSFCTCLLKSKRKKRAYFIRNPCAKDVKCCYTACSHASQTWDFSGLALWP